MSQSNTELPAMVGENAITQTEQTTAVGEVHAETSHEPTLFAEPLFHFGPLPVTNSLVMSWVVVLIVVIASVGLRLRLKRIPRGMQNVVERVIEAALELGDSVTGDRHRTLRFFPIVFALFLFILLNNWLGLLPGIGSVGFYEGEGVAKVFIPFFRGGTADLNTTVALALIAVIGSHLAGIWLIGFWKHFNKFVNIEAFVQIPRKIWSDPTIVLVNPIKAFVGVIEIIGEAAKVASLSFRLFGNIFAGEVLLASMAALVAYIVPIPFMFLELIVGFIQALIFAVLTLVYMTIASSAEEH